jgi:lipopolysaccharide transport system ATP-binding protein
MPSPAIHIESLTKSYARGKVQATSLQSRFREIRPAKWFSGSTIEYFDALKNIDLEIATGDRVGIVGPNGAGKSTLLKLLSRVTYPTKGKITIHGTLGSMLEVGMGFHPDLTGRENIFLNGAILGMRRQQIAQKLDSIIAFSELEAFIETPVKHYSSGMYVRLAFAVAAHLEPDILLIDEVLAVGDMAFRKKCLDKILDISGEGRTLLMVSHQMSYLTQLCQTGIYLRQGEIRSSGAIDDVIRSYMTDAAMDTVQDVRLRSDRSGHGQCKLVGLKIMDERRQEIPVLHAGQHVIMQFELQSSETAISLLEVRVDCFDYLGRQWFVLNNNVSDSFMGTLPNHVTLECSIPKWPLNEGRCYFDVSVFTEKQLSDQIHHVAEMDIEKGMFYATGRLPLPSKGVLIPYQWRIAE